MKLLCLLFLFLPVSLFSQKEIYIPIEWQQGSLDYSFDRSAASDNFIVFWGPLAGTDPTQAPVDIAFDPASILNTAEDLYTFYIDTIRFLDDEEGLLSQYKIILVMLHTWSGLEGWAFGGNYDGTVGAMWMHPHAASSGPTLAHEFTHTLQNYAWMMNPGHGFIDSSYVGFFWETHAEFMALQKYPSVALEFDMARWLNTCQFHWSSTRHHYQAFIFLQYIKEQDGIEMINRMWSESNIGEHPLETYKRLKGINQEELNDLFGDYAMRNVVWDYEIGDLLRERIATLDFKYVAHETIIPEVINAQFDWYRIPNHLAPQDYGYNIIRLYPKQDTGCDKRWVRLHLIGHTLLPDYEEAGWRYGLVAIDQNGQPRYSELKNREDEFTFELEADERELYLVVAGAPHQHHNYKWEIGFPKIYRYPYDFRIDNAWPEGYQPGFRSIPPGVTGGPHSNGGGFVAATAHVDPTAYVGRGAMVLDQAQVLDQARINDAGLVKEQAIVSGKATVNDFAVVGNNATIEDDASIHDYARISDGTHVSDEAQVKGSSLLFLTSVYEQATVGDNTFTWGASLHGDIVLGGDAEFFRECDAGVYMQVEFAYDRNCDGLTDHPANVDITDRFLPLPVFNDSSIVCDRLLDNKEEYVLAHICPGEIYLHTNGVTYPQGVYELLYTASNGADSLVILEVKEFIEPIIIIDDLSICEGDSIDILGHIISAPGDYELTFYYGDSCSSLVNFTITLADVNTAVEIIGNTLWAVDQSATYQWYDCNSNQPIPGAVNRNFTPVTSGTYKVNITSAEGCREFSDCFPVTITATNNPSENLKWQISPNPAKDFLIIKFNDEVNFNTTIRITDLIGRNQFLEDQASLSNIRQLDIRYLSPGLYTVCLIDSQGNISTKLFLKR